MDEMCVCVCVSVYVCALLYQNIMNYLLSEAREKKQTAFKKGWKITIIKVTLSPDGDADAVVTLPAGC